MDVRLSNCASCGIDLAWISGLDHRPLEAKPSERRDSDAGYVVVRQAGKRVFAPSVDHPNAPEHYRIHVCYTWLAERRDRVASIGELVAWSERADERHRDSQRQRRRRTG